MIKTRNLTKRFGHNLAVDHLGLDVHEGEIFGLYDKLSARENLSLYANLQEVSNPERPIEHYLRLLGLWERRNELTGSFSKGLRQKLALARALIHEPRVLLLDEPTAALDPKSARTVHDFIAEVRGEGRTVLICSTTSVR